MVLQRKKKIMTAAGAAFAMMFTLLTECEAQGVMGIFGWNGGPMYFGHPGSNKLGIGRLINIEGESGRPMTIAGPRTACFSGGGSIGWEGSARIVSGELPPGLVMEPRPHKISGMPEKPGEWTVVILLDPVVCDGRDYSGIEETLVFRIRRPATAARQDGRLPEK